MSAPRQFKVNRSAFSRHYTVLDTDGRSPLFYVDQSVFTKDKASLTLHAGGDTAAPVVAVAHFPRFSFDATIGLGDPATDDAGVVWEELTRETRDASAHQWSMTLPAGGGGGERRTYLWKRTHKVSADGMKSSKMTTRDLKLVDAATSDVVGIFTSKYGWSSCGVLQINQDLGREFDIMVTVTMLVVYEKARRRRARAGAMAGAVAA